MKFINLFKRIVAGISCVALATTMFTALPAFANESNNDYEYYATLDPNGDEYQSWKTDVISTSKRSDMLRSVLTNNTLISNEYIEFNTSNIGLYTIGTTGGNPSVASDDNKKMLYGHPGGGTSKTTINVNGVISQFTASDITYDAVNSKSTAKSTYNGIDVAQELSIIENSATGREDVVQIKYTVKNTTDSSQDVGLRIMMDTMLGNNDAAPFRVNGKNITTETEYVGHSIPQIWQAFDTITNPGVVAQGTFYKSGDLKPDKVQFTNWGHVTSTLWNYITQNGYTNGDSAVSITWNENVLASGEIREYVTYYGLSELEQDLVPPIALSVYADNVLEYKNGEYGNINMSIYLDNIGNVDVSNVVLSVSTPNYLECISSTSFPLTYSTMTSGSQRTINLSYKLKSNLSVVNDLEDEIKITLTYPIDSTNNEVKEITKKIKIPTVKKAIVIVPGIMGSQLFRENGDRCWEPFWVDSDMSIDWDDNKIINALIAGRLANDFLYLSCDKNGDSDDPVSVGTQYYGALDSYENLYKRLLSESFSEDTDIIFYAFDWRLDLNTQVSNLNQKIKEYDDVNFVAHSMGGLLVDCYVNKYNTENISKVVTLGTPFWGAPLAGKVLLSGNLSDVFGDSSLGYAGPFIQSLTRNFTSMYELLPTEDYVFYESWLKERTINYTGAWWEFWKFDNVDIQLSFDETNDIIADMCNEKLLNKALSLQNSINNNSGYNGIETIAFIGNSTSDTFSSMSYAYTSEGFITVPSYVNTTNGDSIVPLLSSKQRFSTFKTYGYSHMSLAEKDDVIDDVILFIKEGTSAVSNTDSNKARIKAQKSVAAVATLQNVFNTQLAFKGNMNMQAISEDNEFNLILSKVDDSWLGIYDNSNVFKIDRMGNLNNQEMYICTYSDNKYSYTFESLEDQSVDFVFSDGTDSFVVSGIEVSEGSIIIVNTQNKTVSVNENTYRFRNINPITIDEQDVSLKSKNIFNNTITDTIATRIKLTNLSDKDIDINDLEIVYLYDNDGNSGEVFECDWAGLDNTTINSSVNGTISYDEELGYSKVTLSFSKDENSIISGNADLDIHFRVHTSNWDSYDLSNDYSLNGNEYTENSRILIYYNGILVTGNAE